MLIQPNPLAPDRYGGLNSGHTFREKELVEVIAPLDQTDEEVARAVAFADHSPDPTPDQIFDNAYAQPVANAPHQLPGDPVVPAVGSLATSEVAR